MRDLKNRAKELPKIHSLADWETARNKNLKNKAWACACGSRKFYLIQDSFNVKTICIKCSNMEIIMWNGSSRERGAMRRLDTGKWLD